MIDLTNIPDEGLRLDGHIETLPVDGGCVLSDLDWHLLIMPPSPDFFIEVKGSATLSGFCARCLEPVSAALIVDSQFLGSKDPGLIVGGSYTLSRSDLDIIFFSGAFLDEEAIIREQFHLQVPVHVLCSDMCAGLCCSCGNSLNKGSCVCKTEVQKRSGTLARALVDLKLNLNDIDVGGNSCS